MPPLAAQGVRASVGGGGGGGAEAAACSTCCRGPRSRSCKRYSEQLLAKVKTIPGVVDADTTLNVGKPELSVRIDRPKAADLGVPLADAADALRLLVGGDAVTTYNEGGEQYEVHVRAEADDRDSEAAIGRLPVPSRLGTVALENVASFSAARRRRTSTAGAAAAGHRDRSTCCRARRRRRCRTRSRGGRADRPRRRTTAAGSAAGRASSNARRTAFLTAFALSLIFMYLVLAAQFESWLHPVTILLSLPLTLPFALLSLIVFQQSLNIFSALGLLVLFGVVKKNSILQIDHANQLKERGPEHARRDRAGSREPAAADSDDDARVRRRHGAAGRTSGVGSATNHAIGWVIIGGQTLVLLLTLLVTPVTYTLFDDLREKRLVVRGVRWIASGTGRRARHAALISCVSDSRYHFVLALLRIVTGFIVWQHGAQALFGMLGAKCSGLLDGEAEVFLSLQWFAGYRDPSCSGVWPSSRGC